VSVCFKRSAAAFKFHMPLPKKAEKQTREEVLSKLDPKTDKETDKMTASAATKRGERETEVIKNEKVADEPKPPAASNAISSKTQAPPKIDAPLKGSVPTKAAVEKGAVAEKKAVAEKEGLAETKAVAAAVAKPEERELKRPRSI
jgi:hypothetical protein